MNFFTIKYFNGVYTDYSIKLKDYGTPSIPLTISDTDYLYIGNYKPFNNLFIQLATPNNITSSLSAEYFDGTAWQALTIIDETYNFFESGFIKFNLPETWASNEVDANTKFWIRFKTDISQSQIDISGIGILFSNDLDLIAARSNIVSKHNNGNSWVVKHEEARKEIIGRLRRLGNVKVKESKSSNLNSQLFFGNGKTDLMYIDITEYDILDIEQLREASKLKAMELIYLNELTDESDDKYERQGKRYNKKYEEAMQLVFLKLDLNDDGKIDPTDNNNTFTTQLIYS